MTIFNSLPRFTAEVSPKDSLLLILHFDLLPAWDAFLSFFVDSLYTTVSRRASPRYIYCSTWHSPAGEVSAFSQSQVFLYTAATIHLSGHGPTAVVEVAVLSSIPCVSLNKERGKKKKKT